MYIDAVVVAGIVTVLLILGFFVGVAIFVIKDQKSQGFPGRLKSRRTVRLGRRT